MAKIMNLGNDTDIVWLYNVSYPVGPDCLNHRDDVMLIQHAINCIMVQLQLRKPDGSPITSYLHRDGLWGPRTAEAILAYQQNVKSRGRFIKPDGRVDPSPTSGWTRHGDAQYTIVYLNRDNRDITGKMMQVEDFPKELQLALHRNSPNLA